MNHDNAVQLIEELHHGTLVGHVRNALLSHMDLCRECTALSETYVTISDAYVVEQEHPSSLSMARYAVNPADLDEDERDRVASHLGGCATCRLELDVTREAEAEISRVQAARDEGAAALPITGISHFRAGLAAAILVAALGYPAYLGLTHLPRIKEKLAQLESVPPSITRSAENWSGNVQMVVLNPRLRSGDRSVPSLEIGEDPYVVLAVDFSATDDERQGGAARLAIQDADGLPVWSKELSGASIDRDMQATGAVAVLVPVAILRPGRLTTSVTHDRNGGEEELFQADFRVVQASGGATSSSPRR